MLKIGVVFVVIFATLLSYFISLYFNTRGNRKAVIATIIISPVFGLIVGFSVLGVIAKCLSLH